MVPHRPAVLTAKVLATIDYLSKGRLTLGIGVGWCREEFEAIAAAPFDDRGNVTEEVAVAKIIEDHFLAERRADEDAQCSADNKEDISTVVAVRENNLIGFNRKPA